MHVELCCGSYSDALTAWQCGADRVELCSSIYFGGLTPSLSTLALLKEKTDMETAVMIRPREGGFCYSDEEFELMLRDGEEFIRHGCDALVFGFLTKDGFLDTEKSARFLAMINGRVQSVFHKAFDVCRNDLTEGAVLLQKLGVTRILTAGKEKTALAGACNLKKLIDLGGIGILPAGSIRSHNIEELIRKTGTDWVHTSAFCPHFDDSAQHENIFFTPAQAPKQGEYPKADPEIIRRFLMTAANTPCHRDDRKEVI